MDLVGLDRCREQIADGQRDSPSAGLAAVQIIGDGQQRTDVVGRVAPFRRKPRVVEVEPPD